MAAPALIGADTSLLVAHSLIDHPERAVAGDLIDAALSGGHLLALCPVVIDEFIHVVTDSRRFEQALPMKDAITLAQTWCQSKETILLHPTDESVELQMEWLLRYRLGRKRLHDTQIAAIYHLGGVETILSSNWRDFRVFSCFEVRTLS